MKIETLIEANKIAKELDRWNDIALRLGCGDAFYVLSFKASQNKTMSTEFEYQIRDEKIITYFKKFVDEQIKRCNNAIEKL